MNDFITNGAATSPVLVSGRSGEAAGARRTVPPVHKVEGTGLPIGGFGTGFVASGVAVVLTGADRVRGGDDRPHAGRCRAGNPASLEARQVLTHRDRLTFEAAESHTWDPRPQCFPPSVHCPIEKTRR